MTKRRDIARVPTGIENLDAILRGGIPRGAAIIVTGAPGSGKTIFCQQTCFHNASPRSRVLCFNTLSEPTAKTFRHLQQFAYFDAEKIGRSVEFVDLGLILRTEGLEAASALIMRHVKKNKPKIVVIDSFKVFDERARSSEEFRKFGYELVVNLMAWETTCFLVGEYGPEEYERNSLFSIVDGLIVLSQRESLGEHQRFLKVIKMRGTDHSRDQHPFVIRPEGLKVFAPRVGIRREVRPAPDEGRCRTGIARFDELLGPGIPWGSSLLVGGVAGTGKTVLSLEFAYRGALAGEKGIVFSFEETEERLLATAAGMGWDLEREIERGMIEIVFIPQPDIMVEANLVMMAERIAKMGARRVVVDSVSVFLHKVDDPQLSREKVFHLCSVVQNAQAVGFFSADIPYGSRQVSRLGVEETVVDGVVILSSTEEGLERQRYIEVYKLRNTPHLKGRHSMSIAEGGISIFPRYTEELVPELPPALEISLRLGSGVPGLDELLDGGVVQRSATLISGSAGVGKSTFGVQFLLEGARLREPGLYVTLEEGPAQLLASADALGLPLRAAVDEGLIEVLYVSREHVRAGQFLTVLSDRLNARKATRLVLDSVTHMINERGGALEDLRYLLYRLVIRFKALGVTSVLTLEAPSLYSMELGSERSLSPVADNLLLLRYAKTEAGLVPSLTIVKTRGSSHDRGTHPIDVGHGGMRIAAGESARGVVE